MCTEDFKREQVDIDHIKPIVPLREGFTSWDEYIGNLFCPAEGFQILCKDCHEIKTKMEDTMRMQYKTTIKDYEGETKVKFKTKKMKNGKELTEFVVEENVENT